MKIGKAGVMGDARAHTPMVKHTPRCCLHVSDNSHGCGGWSSTHTNDAAAAYMSPTAVAAVASGYVGVKAYIVCMLEAYRVKAGTNGGGYGGGPAGYG